MVLTIIGFFAFLFLLALLSCADNQFAKPIVGCCLCGYENIEKEKRRRRQLHLEQTNKRNEEMKQQNAQQPYNPAQPQYGHQQNHAPQNYAAQSPGMNQPYNPTSPADPYSNAYPAPAYQAPYQAPNQPNFHHTPNSNAEPGPPVAQPKQGFMDKAKGFFGKK